MRDDEIFFTLGDLKRLLIRNKRTFTRVVFFSALSIFLVLAFREPKFQATATFRQSQNGDENVGKLRNLLNVVMLSEQDRGAVALMQSHRLGRMVVEKLGLQASIGEGNFLTRRLSNFWGSLCAEWDVARQDVEGFVFREVAYEGEVPLLLYFRFDEAGGFELLDQKKQHLAHGKIGEAVHLKEFRGTLLQVPTSLSSKKIYPLTISPWLPTVKQHLSQLQVKPMKQDKNLLRLFYSHRDRQLAALFLNEMMSGYQRYLKSENEELSDAQLAYLEKRQDELSGKLDRVLQEQALYLKKNLGESGFIGLKEEVEMLAGPKEAYTSRLFDLEMEEKRLEKRREQDQELDRTWVSKKTEKVKGRPHKEVEKRFQNQLASLRLEEELAATSAPLAAEPKTVIDELEGITLVTAQNLYASYQKELDEIQRKMRQISYLRKRIHTPDFEISSLGGILNDSVGQSMVQQAAQLSLQLRDEQNHSLKEMARLKEALETEKTFLSHHMEQVVELEKVRATLVEEKILSLQAICLDLIKKEKGLIQEKLKELSQKMEDLPEKWKRESHLQFTKELSMGIIEGISKVVESKNLTHNLFHVDSKPLDSATPPLVPTKPQLLLLSLGGGLIGGVLLFLICLGRGLLTGFPLSLESLKFQGVHSPGPLSSYCNAPLKEVGANDLHTLRGVQHWLLSREKKSSCVVLVGGRLPDYSTNLAELLALQNKRVLLIRSAFDGTISSKEGAGLWHYLEGLTTTIVPEKRRGYDYISTGGTSRHAPELLGRESFKALLEHFKHEYDLLLIYSTAEPAFVDAHLFFRYADAILVSAFDEKAEDLVPYRRWENAEKTRGLSVVCMEGT